MALGGLGFRIHLGIEKRSKKGYFFCGLLGLKMDLELCFWDFCDFLMIELVFGLLLKRLVIGW